jgi:DNA-binding LacI/PurR family transcriptional regulator
MSHAADEYTTVHRLAQRLERDIRLKGLGPGDPYLTATEAAQMLGCSRTLASRALFSLGERDLLIRRRGQGAVIGPAMQVDPKPRLAATLQTILVLEPLEMLEIGIMRIEALLPLVRRRFDQAMVHLLCLPQRGDVEYVRQIVEQSRKGDMRTAVIAISCARPVYAYLAECGLPTVVLGSLFPDLQPLLPSIDFDHYQAGQLLMACLAARGHRRVGLMLGDAGRPGTERLLNGVLAGMHAAGLSPTDLVTRFYPGTKEGCMAQLKDLLTMPDRPGALITDGGFIPWVSAVAAELGLSIPDQLDVSCLSYTHGTDALSGCPRVEPVESPEQVVSRVVETLWRRTEGLTLEENNVLIPLTCGELTAP